MTDFDQIRKLASLRTKTVSLCLSGEIVEEIDDLEARLESAPAAASMGDATRRELAEQIIDAQQRMQESVVAFHLRALPAREWTKLNATQPTLAEGEAVAAWRERMWPWYFELISRSVTAPAMTVEQVGELADLLHYASFNELADACLILNGGRLDVPNSEAASALTRDSEQT